MVNENPMQPGGSEQLHSSWSDRTVPDASAIDSQPTRPDQAVVLQPGSSELSLSSATIENQPTKPQAVLTQNEEAVHPGGAGSVPVISIRDLYKTYILGKKTRVDALQG